MDEALIESGSSRAILQAGPWARTYQREDRISGTAGTRPWRSGGGKRGGARSLKSNKHDKGKSPFRSDLDRNPGIGQSKGSFMAGIPPEEIEGENRVEGDDDNDTTASDGLPEEEREWANS